MDKIIKYGLVVLRDGKFLINRKFGTRLFLMPGGKPEEGESEEKCLVREIMEEHGCELIRKSIKFFGNFEDVAVNDPDKLVSMKVYLGEVNGEPAPNSEIEEQKWFGKNDDHAVLSPIIKNKILPSLLENNLI